MPCSDSSSSIVLILNPNETFRSFNYAKITCGREITADTGLNAYFFGKALDEILDITFQDLQSELKSNDEETQFILYLEWDALRSTIAQYLGRDDAHLDPERCHITSIDYTEEGIEIAEVILPPKNMPKILPCSLGDNPA